MSSFTINADRLKQVNMVSYFSAGTLWATQKGNPAGVSLDEPCGKKIAVQKGTVQVDDITARDKKCTDAGKPKITIDQYQGQDQATTAVVTGKDDAMLADSPVTATPCRRRAASWNSSARSTTRPLRLRRAEGPDGLRRRAAGRPQAAMADGSYAKALGTWASSPGPSPTPP